MHVLFKPMLSATVEDVTKLRFPLLASHKLDGIRAIVLNGVVVSRNLKPIPNRFIQQTFGRKEFNGFDGELIMGDPTDPAAFRNTTSAVMSIEGEPEVGFHVFDYAGLDCNYSFETRFDILKMKVGDSTLGSLVLVRQKMVNNQAELDLFEGLAVDHGHEGVMLRSKEGLYKFGRSTFKEHGLMKLKRFDDAEATIIDFEEQMRNENAATTSLTGGTERSHKKAGMKGKGTLGALKVKGLNGAFKGVEFNIGSGFDDALRASIWANREEWKGRVVKYKFFPIGSKDAPRFPVYLGIRFKGDR